MEKVAAAYEKDYGVPVLLQLGGSQTLLANLQVTQTGDLFLPADDSYLQLAEEKQLTLNRAEIATQSIYLVISADVKSPPKNLTEALQQKLSFALSNPDTTAIGKLIRQSLPAATFQQLEQRAATTAATVTEAANAVKAGAAQATFIWDAMLSLYPDLHSIPCAELAELQSQVSFALLKNSKSPAQAMHFVRYATAKDKGLTHFKKLGFNTIAGDNWTEKPELTVYAGSMLRPAIEQTLIDFEQREGIPVTRVYNGCGILVAQMKAGKHPDAYFACDQAFMEQMQSSFPKPEAIAQNQLVILVQKGNPHRIADLKDLIKPGLKVGIGHEKQCAMGWITQKTFTESGITEKVMQNVTVQTPTGDMLVNQMQTGSLDAAVTYLSNAVGAGDKLDAVAIQGVKCSVATQPFAIWKDTPHVQLAKRLHSALASAESKNRFEAEGFSWQKK
jgi:ABC-type molybdate transport system substrate-binding protein